MRWILPERSDPVATRFLAEALQIPSAIAELLWRRGFRTPEMAKPHLEPRLASLADPFLLPDMQAAVDRILAAVDKSERIVLFGDYDVVTCAGVDNVVAATRANHIVAVGAVQSFVSRRALNSAGGVVGIARCLSRHHRQARGN